MIIHSDFKDYYDTASAYGVDTTVHWPRDRWYESSKLSDFEATLPESIWLDADDRDYVWKPSVSIAGLPVSKCWRSAVIGFCGKLYPFIYIRQPVKVDTKCEDDWEWQTEQCFYTYDKWREFTDCLKTPQYVPKARHRRFYRHNDNERIFQQSPYSHDALFIELNAPVFLAEPADRGKRKINIWKNPILKDWKFYKVKDPATAFQDIQMYLTNQLVKEKEVDEIADKYRIAQHGYDKFSFRHPTKL
jgi:hypothetical protein